jgi:hypothetical protein
MCVNKITVNVFGNENAVACVTFLRLAFSTDWRQIR